MVLLTEGRDIISRPANLCCWCNGSLTDDSQLSDQISGSEQEGPEVQQMRTVSNE